MSVLPVAPPTTGGVPFAATLATHGDAVALVSPSGDVTYAELSRRVDHVASRLGDVRRLVLVATASTTDAVVAYLAALVSGHPVLLAPADDPAALRGLVAAYDPDVVMAPVQGRWLLDERRPGTAHDLHPDLALLLSSSGSTGSPKLVRLSHENVQSNAEAIAAFLGITGSDRAPTTLPLHYCYGLSVLNSHLVRGAGIVLTDLSVVDACFWNLFRDSGCTSLAGVPHTFELLDRAGFERMSLPRLRRVTQAGGRLSPGRVRAFAELGVRRGWDLFVMYGQTEATARMAYLPPDLAMRYPASIGIPVPGGDFEIRPVDGAEPGTGELVFRGPGVMLGYAETAADLARGRTVDVLRTGDLARQTPEGLYQVVGRLNRFVKLFGLRIDLERVEGLLAREGLDSYCLGDDDQLVVVLAGGDAGVARRVVTQALRLPGHAVRVAVLPELPRLASGKPDYRLAGELSRAQGPLQEKASGPASPVEAVRLLFAELLDRPDAMQDSTFVSLGGDSLSYVEMSVRLEELLGGLPAGWHTMTVQELVDGQKPADAARRRTRRTVETSVALRALAILLVVGTHIGLFTALGSAHVLVAVAGFNFARFQVTSSDRLDRFRRQLASLARVVVPSVVWIGGACLLTDSYRWPNVVLLNAVLGPPAWTVQWHFWFVEVLVYILLGLTLLLVVPAVDRLERRAPFVFALGLLAVGLVWRFHVVDLGVLNPRPVFWLFAIGWAAARATSLSQRLVVTAVALASVPGFFDSAARLMLIGAGLLLLVWAPSVRCPRLLTRVAGVLASASLYVYLTHWQVYPLLVDASPVLALAASLAVGTAYWRLSTWATGLVGRRWLSVRSGKMAP